MENKMRIELDALPENEGFARVAVAAFVTYRNPTMEEISDIKTAVSEAVTNAVIHAYEEKGGQRKGDCGHRTGDGAALYEPAGSGTLRHGLRLYGSLYGQP